MHSFKEFMELNDKQIGYGYVSVKPSSETISILRKLINDSDIVDTLPNSELHMTIAYDTNNPVLFVNPSNDILRGTIKEAKILNDSLVVVMDSEDAQARFNELHDLGFNTDYPDYIPHVSLKYGATKEDLLMVRNTIKRSKLQGTPTSFYSETWEWNCG